MFPTFRPSFGFLFMFLGWSLVTVAGCAPKEAVIDSWKLTPPTIGLTNAAGLRTKVAASNLRAFTDTSNFADASAEIEFAPEDRGLASVFKSRCIATQISGAIKTDEHTQNLVTSANVPLAKVLPPSVLNAASRGQDWSCNIKMTVTNRHGSQSSGELRGIRVNFAPMALVSVTKSEILIPGTVLEDLYHRKLFSWTIRNDQQTAQVIFIAAKPDSVRLATVTTWKTVGTFLSTDVSAQPRFSAAGAIEERQTTDGFYFRIAGEATATVYLHSNRPANNTSLVGFDTETSHLVLLLNSPMTLSTLRPDRQSASLVMAAESELNQLPREPVDVKPLLTSTVLERNPLTGFLTPARMTFNELSMIKKSQASVCLVVYPDRPMANCE